MYQLYPLCSSIVNRSDRIWGSQYYCSTIEVKQESLLLKLSIITDRQVWVRFLIQILWLLHRNYRSSYLEKEKCQDKEQLLSINQDFWITPSDTCTPTSLQKCGVRTRWTWERTELNVSVGAWKENIQINTMILLIE